MSRLASLCIFPTFTVLLANCAAVDVAKVTRPDQPGLRYWRPSTFVTLSSSTVGGQEVCKFDTLTLPDRSEEYAITINAGVGAAKMTPELKDGWRLDKISTDVDSKTAENINAASNLLKAVAPGGFVAQPKGKDAGIAANCFGIYKIVYNENGEIAGLQEIKVFDSRSRNSKSRR